MVSNTTARPVSTILERVCERERFKLLFWLIPQI